MFWKNFAIIDINLECTINSVVWMYLVSFLKRAFRRACSVKLCEVMRVLCFLSKLSILFQKLFMIVLLLLSSLDPELIFVYVLANYNSNWDRLKSSFYAISLEYLSQYYNYFFLLIYVHSSFANHVSKSKKITNIKDDYRPFIFVTHRPKPWWIL